MSEKETLPGLGAAEAAKALRCCATTAEAGGGCKNCPLDRVPGEVECAELACLEGARLLEELAEENRRLRGAVGSVCDKKTGELARAAGEANAALDRGLGGVNREHISRMLGIQAELTALGLESDIRMDPVGETGWRVLGVTVGGRVVFGEAGEVLTDGL